jgi:hypothetical protein
MEDRGAEANEKPSAALPSDPNMHVSSALKSRKILSIRAQGGSAPQKYQPE